MSCFPPPYVWLATGKEKATPSDLLPLAGKSVVVFPDKGDYNKWQETLQAVPNLLFHISDVMEKVQGDCHTIAQMVLSQQPLRPTEVEAALIRMEDANPNLALLVKTLDLEVVGNFTHQRHSQEWNAKTGACIERVERGCCHAINPVGSGRMMAWQNPGMLQMPPLT